MRRELSNACTAFTSTLFSTMIARLNRRKAPRLSVDIPVVYLGKEFIGRGRVINVSPSGILIRGDYIAIVGTHIGLRIDCPDCEEPIEIERAVVRWRSGSTAEFGVEILSMSPTGQMWLMNLMSVILQQRGCQCSPKWPWLCRCVDG